MKNTFLRLRIGMVFRDDIELFEVFSVLRDEGIYARLFPSPTRLAPACSLLLLIQPEDSDRVLNILRVLRKEPIRILKLDDDIISLHFES